ncbi:MAG: sugar transferase [Candidatus Aureabacteria bacterium]|nr:sugar transferase [Candidatus Auribacterota bacterium]
MLHERDKVVRRAMIILDAFIVSLSFVYAFFLRQYFHSYYRLDIFSSVQVVEYMPVSLKKYSVVLFLALFVWGGMLYLNNMYGSMRRKAIFEIIWIVIKSAFFTAVVFGSMIFFFKLRFVSRMFFAIFMTVSPAFVLLEKIAVFNIMRYARKQGYNFRRLLVVGTGKRAADFIEKVKNRSEWGLKILGVVCDEPGRGVKKVRGIDVIGDIKDLPLMLYGRAVDEVVFVVPRSRLNHIEKALYTCETKGVKATVAVDLFNLKLAKSRQTEIDGMPLLTFETTVAREWEFFIKRAIDIILSGFALIILSPVFALTALMVKLTSYGPVLFVQKRVGLNGRTFSLYKFRSMYKKASEKLTELEVMNEMSGPVFKMKQDPRITRVGKFLRKFSIDEFPQFFNVLLGHMSLIGPRPPLPEEVAKYEFWQSRRLSMRPGLTCLWQISGRNKVDFNEWMKLDLRYLDNWSLWLDFKIFVKTIPVVLFGIGGY